MNRFKDTPQRPLTPRLLGIILRACNRFNVLTDNAVRGGSGGSAELHRIAHHAYAGSRAGAPDRTRLS
jgi:hypothetical protein